MTVLTVIATTLSIFAIYLSCKLYERTVYMAKDYDILYTERSKQAEQHFQKHAAYLQDQITNLRQIVADHIDDAEQAPEPALTFGDLSQSDLFTAGDDDILRKRLCGDGNCFSIESGCYYELSDSTPVIRMYADFMESE